MGAKMKDFATSIKCTCGETRLYVIMRHDCKECPKNGFSIDCEVAEELNIEEESPYYYDEDTRVRAEEIAGYKVVRTEAEDEGECKIGTNWNAGCSRYVCSACGKHVDFVAFVQGC